MKKILLMTVLLVIGFSSMVNAQCGWVLWKYEHRIMPGGRNCPKCGDRWIIEEAFPDYYSCIGKQPGVLTHHQDVYRNDDASMTLSEYKCLPDTIDPRK